MTRKVQVVKATKESEGRVRRVASIIQQNRNNFQEPDDTDRFYEIEKLLDKRLNEETEQVEYLVRWKDYPPEEDTWEPVHELNSSSEDLVRKFEADLRRASGLDSDEPEITDERLHCICRTHYKMDGAMILCMSCNRWYHFPCIAVDMELANAYLKFYCKPCQTTNPNLKCRIKPEKAIYFRNRISEGLILDEEPES